MRLIALAFAAFLLALPASAEPLTDEGIAQWAESYTAVMDWADANKVNPGAEPRADMFRHAILGLQKTPDYEGFSAVLADHGYSDPLAWADLSDRIAGTYSELAFAAALPQLEQYLQDMLQDPHLTEPERQEILVGLEELEEYDPNMTPYLADPEDWATVKRNGAIIGKAMGY